MASRPHERLAQFAEIGRFLSDAVPVVPLLARHDLYAASPDLRFEPRLDGRLLAAEMSWRGR